MADPGDIHVSAPRYQALPSLGLLLLAAVLLHLLAKLNDPLSHELWLGVLALLLCLLLGLGWQRLQARTGQQLQALALALAEARREAAARDSEALQLRTALRLSQEQLAELSERRQRSERAVLSALTPAPSSRPLPLHLPPAGAAADLRQLLRNTVHAQGERLRGCALGLDLEPELLIYTDAACLHALIVSLLQASMAARPARLHLRAALFGLDVVDIELSLRGLQAPLPPVPEAEQQALQGLQGTLSLFEDEDGSCRWRLLIPRVLHGEAP